MRVDVLTDKEMTDAAQLRAESTRASERLVPQACQQAVRGHVTSSSIERSARASALWSGVLAGWAQPKHVLFRSLRSQQFEMQTIDCAFGMKAPASMFSSRHCQTRRNR
eukprot:3976325-Amphidinium_carterae.1